MSIDTSWINKTPGVQGGDACIRTAPDLEAAWDYADRHLGEIEAAIRANAEA